MKRFISLLVAFAFAFLCASQTYAKPVKVKDNLGRIVIVDDGTTVVPPGILRAASELQPMGATDTTVVIPLGYSPKLFDFAFTLAATGNNDGTATSENMVLGAALLWYAWPTFAFGPGFDYVNTNFDEIKIHVPAKLFIFNNDFSSIKPMLLMDILPSFSVFLDDGGNIYGGAWSWRPMIGLGTEFPMNGYSIDVGMGAGYAFTDYGATTNSFDGFKVLGTVNGWLGR